MTISHSFVLACLALVVPVIGALGTKYQWWVYTTGFLLLALGVLIATGVLFHGAWNFFRGHSINYASIGTALLPLVFVSYTLFLGFRYPVLHDVTTDPQRPVALNLAQQLRKSSDHDVAYKKEFAHMQQQTWPDIKPLFVAHPPDTVYQQVQTLLEECDWFYQGDPQNHELHAVEMSRLFGFRDDVGIRIEATPEGSRLDIRSASRVGKSDLGANATRVTFLLNELKKRLE